MESNLVQLLKRTFWAVPQEIKIKLYDPAIPLLGIHPKKIKSPIPKGYLYSWVHFSIQSSQNIETLLLIKIALPHLDVHILILVHILIFLDVEI